MNADIDMSGVTLRTQRLILRPWRESDDRDMFEYAKDPDIGPMAGWIPHRDILESREIVRSFIDGRRTFALELDGKVIGSLGLERYNEEQLPEFADRKCRSVGYVLSKEYWGRGLMPEAVKEAIRWAFVEAGVEVLFCGHFDWNSRSHRVQEKCGFRYYCDQEYTTASGKVEHGVINILTREDWEKDREEADKR